MARYAVLSPDDLPIRPAPFRTRAAAERALEAWCARFVAQGYYAAVGERIILEDLPARCTILEQTTGERAGERSAGA